MRPQLIGQFEFVEWTEDAHLRHSRFIALRDDKKAKDVKKERWTMNVKYAGLSFIQPILSSAID